MKKAAAYAILGISLLFIVVTVFIYIAPHIGWSVNSVISGSMEPALETGSLIVTSPTEPEEVEIGDIILFYQPSITRTMITHRVIDIQVNSPISFLTQGDANLNPDPFRVPGQNLVGKVILHIPSAGYFIEFVKKPVGFISLIIVPSVIIFAMYVFSVWRVVSDNSKQKVGVPVEEYD
jgi:signal peptidase